MAITSQILVISVTRVIKNGHFTVRLKFVCVCVFILDYDSMYSEMDLTPEKSFSSNYKNSQLLLTAAAALSQNGQIAV